MNASDEILFLHIDDLHPHPDNPRKDLGDLTELAASIKARGVMQNLTVVPADDGDGYTIIIGHRRAAAAKLAGLSRLPCIVSDLTPREQMEIMLTENMQRADLTPEEREREAMIDDRINSLTKLTEQAYRRRREYISKAADGVIGRYEVDAMLCAFAALAIRSTSDWVRDPDFKILAKLENVDEKTPRGKARDMMLENLDGVNDKQARRTELNALYGCFNDGPGAQYWMKFGVNGFPAYAENWILDALYDFLIGMGYELSDDEKALMNGTHELFKDPEHPKK